MATRGAFWRLKAPFGSALSLFVVVVIVVVSPMVSECTTTCRMKKDDGGNQHGPGEGQCPVRLTSVQIHKPGDSYTECVTVSVWMKAADFCEEPQIEILSASKIFRPTLTKRNRPEKCHSKTPRGAVRVRCPGSSINSSLILWELEHRCVEAQAKSSVSVTFSTTSKSCSSSYTVPDPIPDFSVSVNQTSKSLLVSVQSRDRVFARWCYRKHGRECRAVDSPPVTIDPSESLSAVLRVPFMLPCVCVQVYFAGPDSRRRVKCPLLHHSVSDVSDVWRSSEVSLLRHSLRWSSLCPAQQLEVSTALCWRHHLHHNQLHPLCTETHNTTLQGGEDQGDRMYNLSSVDTHPQMCLVFSLNGSRHVSCPFTADWSSWEVLVSPGGGSVSVFVSSSAPARFSAQLCVLQQGRCSGTGPVQSGATDGGTGRINVPLGLLDQEPCVQVWQSHPALIGRRIVCPDYTHSRCGLYAVGVSVFLALVVLLVVFIQRVSRMGAAGLLVIQEPVLLVCSSEQSAHVAAVCALASILQAELSAKVHMALWAQSSQTQTQTQTGSGTGSGTGTGTGVADLGPLPWLYGQWEAVRKAQGKVLIVWSPEASKTYARWRANVDRKEKKDEDFSKVEVTREEINTQWEENVRLKEKKLRKYHKKGYRVCSSVDWSAQTEASSVIAPVFTAALACLEVALQEGRGQGVALVYFQGLCHSRDVPKALRGVRRYCLTQDLRGLIQELGAGSRELRWSCWPRILNKILSMWLAQRLSHRLNTLLPHGR